MTSRFGSVGLKYELMFLLVLLVLGLKYELMFLLVFKLVYTKGYKNDPRAGAPLL